jgi:hypothetical protein
LWFDEVQMPEAQRTQSPLRIHGFFVKGSAQFACVEHSS